MATATVDVNSPAAERNHSHFGKLVREVSADEVELLAKLEAANKMIEQDVKSVSGTGSRKSNSSSESAIIENNSQQQISFDDMQEDLWQVWGDLVKNWEIESKKRPQYINDLVRKGIPSHFRTIAWQLLSKADIQAVHEKYAEYMRMHSPHEKVIKRDVTRTYPEHDFFRDGGAGQQSLLNVMKAYSLHDREVGYCQGSAFIAGLLLFQMPEEEAFAVLLRLMEEYRLRELYRPSMTELGLCMFQLENIVQDQLSDIHLHFANMGFDTSMYASSWFLTLFATSLPLELANRIMDVFILDGMEMIFRIAIAILQQCRYDLLQLDMEGMLRYFQREMPQRFENDPDLLMTTAYNVQLNTKKMKKMEKDYLAKRSKEQEEAVELRRLRTESRLLRNRIEFLEQESSALADRLIQRQVNLAEEAEVSLHIKHELFSLKELNHLAHKQLEDAYETIKELSKPRNDLREVEIQKDDEEMIERIHGLQQELIETKIREADNENTIRDLKQRLHELEVANKRLKETPPDHCVATLQEELIAVKMREAEASLAMKELRQKFSDLHQLWLQHCINEKNDEDSHNGQNSQAATENSSKRSKKDGIYVKEVEDQLMGIRIREAETLAELKECRQKVMELETLSHVSGNQIKRQDEENKRLMNELEICKKEEMDLQKKLRERERKISDFETQIKESSVMSKLRETELLENVTELRNRVSDLESRQFEKWTQDQLNRTGLESEELLNVGTPNSLTASFSSLSDDLELRIDISKSAGDQEFPEDKTPPSFSNRSGDDANPTPVAGIEPVPGIIPDAGIGHDTTSSGAN